MTPNHARLLVVDDSASLREAICDVLQGLGFLDIDVVITDWNMPFMNGLELLKAIRGGPERANTPVLLLTGEVTSQRVLEAIAAGANGFIVKPFITPALPEKLMQIVASLSPASEYLPPITVSRGASGRPTYRAGSGSTTIHL